MLKLIAEKQLGFPYLVDESQDTARAYQAQCTPDIYLLKPDMSLFYHGRIDDNWQQEDQVSQEELKHALIQLSTNKNAPETHFHLWDVQLNGDNKATATSFYLLLLIIFCLDYG